MIVVSSCLVGVDCRYNGTSKLNNSVLSLVDSGKAIHFCPEQLGGLRTPRCPCEMVDNKVISRDGIDYTYEYELGAQRFLDLCQVLGITTAILKQYSPSCGIGKIYDGSFSGEIISGNGVAAQLLLDNNISVYSDEDLHLFDIDL